MLFEPQGPALVAEMFRGALYALNRDRKRDAAKRLDFYHDGQLEHLQEVLALKFAEPAKLTHCFVNIVKKVVDLKARVYADEPKRSVDGTEADKALFAEIAEQAALSIKMKTASRYVKLCKTCLARPVWRNGRLDLDILTPDILDVTTGRAPRTSRPCWSRTTRTTARARKSPMPCGPRRRGNAWTTGETRRAAARTLRRVALRAPVGPRPTDSFWIAGGEDLIVMQEAVNKALVDLLHTLEFQGFGLGWVRGAEGGGIHDPGPGKIIELPKDGELGIAAPQAPIDEVVNAIDRLMKWCAVSNGLPGSSMSVDPTDESGVSKIVGNVELEESRRDDIALWRMYERRLFAVLRAVWNFHNPGRKFSDAATLAVDFADPKPDTSEKDQAATWELLLSMGLISPVDAVMERNPDLATREDALAYLIQVRDETAALKEQQI